MSISSDRLKTLTEEQIGKSGEVFGRKWKILYEVISEEEDKLTEEAYLEALSKCKFRNPEYIGFIAFVCPPLCTYITDRIFGEKMKEFYKFILYTWYIMLILSAVQFFIDQKIPSFSTISLFIMCMVATSWSFRDWCKEYNKLELIYHVLKKVEKK